MKQGGLPLVIDFHVHMLDAEVLKASENRTVYSGFSKGGSAQRPNLNEFLRRMLEPDAQIADMDERGIDRSVVTSSTVIQGTTWADPRTDHDLCRRTNDTTAEWVARHPGRFIGSFVLPLQDLERSMQELERATWELKLGVGNISSNYKGVYMGAAHYHPFWEAIEKRGIPVWIHPEGTVDPWFQSHALWNSLGQSIEEAKVMASLIYDGVMHKYPGLTIIMAHGGGYFPHYMGRMDRNAANRPDTIRNTGGKKPGDFLRSFYYDTCVYDTDVIRVLMERVGADRLVLGSDYPVGEKDPVAFLRDCGVSGRELEMIAGGTAAKLLGLEVSV
jgi:aminocarboxymuconate-semialdehyde decarboxylase